MQETRPSLHRADQVAASVFSFSGIVASNRDGVPAIVSGHRSGSADNQDLRLFFFAAMLFFWLAGSRPGCSIVGSGSLD